MDLKHATNNLLTSLNEGIIGDYSESIDPYGKKYIRAAQMALQMSECRKARLEEGVGAVENTEIASSVKALLNEIEELQQVTGNIVSEVDEVCEALKRIDSEQSELAIKHVGFSNEMTQKMQNIHEMLVSCREQENVSLNLEKGSIVEQTSEDIPIKCQALVTDSAFAANANGIEVQNHTTTHEDEQTVKSFSELPVVIKSGEECVEEVQNAQEEKINDHNDVITIANADEDVNERIEEISITSIEEDRAPELPIVPEIQPSFSQQGVGFESPELSENGSAQCEIGKQCKDNIADEENAVSLTDEENRLLQQNGKKASETETLSQTLEEEEPKESQSKFNFNYNKPPIENATGQTFGFSVIKPVPGSAEQLFGKVNFGNPFDNLLNKEQ